MGSAVKISMMFATMYSFRITLGIVGARLRAARCMAGPFRTHAESGSHKLELRNVRVIGFPSSFLCPCPHDCGCLDVLFASPAWFEHSNLITKAEA